MDKLTSFKCTTLLLAACLAAGCATTPESSDSENEPAPQPAQESATPQSVSIEDSATAPKDAPVTRDFPRQSLGIIIRDLAQASNSGIVLMNGLEAVMMPEFTVNDEQPRDALARLAETTGLALHTTPFYDFAYDRDYEALTTLRLDDDLPDSYNDVRVDLAIGSDTPMFSALALLGHSTGLTLVADNAIGAAACGELSLKDIPLTRALEALLQSARIPGPNVRVLASEQYVFLASPAHRMRHELLAKADDTEALLDEVCSLSLLVYQTADGQMNSQLGASQLGKVLPELSLQLGMPVHADKELLTLPVNPVVINDVPRSMALNLLIRQWMVPAFQYEVRQGAVHLRRADSSQ